MIEAQDGAATILLATIGAAWIGYVAGGIIWRLHRRWLPALSRAIDRLGCRLVGHRPGHIVCPDCREVNPDELVAAMPELTAAMRQFGVAVREMAQGLNRLGEAFGGMSWQIVGMRIIETFAADDRDLDRFNTTVYDDRWLEDDSHADTRHVMVHSDEAEPMVCWRCCRRAEASAVGLCRPCLDAVRAGDSVEVGRSPRGGWSHDHELPIRCPPARIAGSDVSSR